MRNAYVRVVLFLCVLTFITTNQAHALNLLEHPALSDNPYRYGEQLLEQEEAAVKPEEKSPEPETPPVAEEIAAAPVPIQHTVARGETLSSVAGGYQTTWLRIFQKNTHLTSPDIINPGDVLTIPTADEALTERALPASQPPVQTSDTPTGRSVSGTARASAPASSAGNTYAPGYCTWYVKNRRPDLPNRLGNAGAWAASASAQGFATGSVPRAGAVGQQGNHVVYVESVNGDGSVTISEMNFGGGLFVVNTRTVPASNFTYIY